MDYIGVSGVGLYKRLFHFKALLWESIILSLPSPTCKAYPIALLLHVHCAINASPPTSPYYAIHHTILVMEISCKGQIGSTFFPISTVRNFALVPLGMGTKTVTSCSVCSHR